MNGAIFIRSDLTPLDRYDRPRLNMKKIGDISVLEHVICRVKKCEVTSKCLIVFPDVPENAKLSELAIKWKIDFFASSGSVVKDLLAAAESIGAESIAFVSDTSIFIDPDIIDEMLICQQIQKYDYLRVDEGPIGIAADVVSVSAIQTLSEFETLKDELEPLELIPQCRFMFRDKSFHLPNRYPKDRVSLTIEKPQDLKYAREIYSQLQKDDEIIIDSTEAVKHWLSLKRANDKANLAQINKLSRKLSQTHSKCSNGICKVLYLNKSPVIMGAQESLINLIKELDKSRFQPIVACSGEGPFTERIVQIGVTPRIAQMDDIHRKNSLAFLTTVSEFVELIRDENIDIIHANNYVESQLGVLLAKFSGVPIVVHLRNPLSPQIVESSLISMANKVIAVSKAVRDNQYIPADTAVIYNGVDLDKFNPEVSGLKFREEFGIAPNIPLIGMVAQFLPWKGHRVFLQAASIVVKSIPMAKFVLVGTGYVPGSQSGELSLLNLIQELNLEENIILTGFRDDMPEVMAALDILVSASLMEAFSRVIIEGMASGKPIVATKVGGQIEAIEDEVTGLLVPPNNPASMAVALIHLIQNSELAASMGEAGRKRAEERVSIAHCTRKTEEVYSSLLQSGRDR